MKYVSLVSNDTAEHLPSGTAGAAQHASTAPSLMAGHPVAIASNHQASHACALDHEEQHKWVQEDFVATATYKPSSIEPDQSTDRNKASLFTRESGNEAHEDSTTAQTDWSTDDYVAEAG